MDGPSSGEGNDFRIDQSGESLPSAIHAKREGRDGRWGGGSFHMQRLSWVWTPCLSFATLITAMINCLFEPKSLHYADVLSAWFPGLRRRCQCRVLVSRECESRLWRRRRLLESTFQPLSLSFSLQLFLGKQFFRWESACRTLIALATMCWQSCW